MSTDVFYRFRDKQQLGYASISRNRRWLKQCKLVRAVTGRRWDRYSRQWMCDNICDNVTFYCALYSYVSTMSGAMVSTLFAFLSPLPLVAGRLLACLPSLSPRHTMQRPPQLPTSHLISNFHTFSHLHGLPTPFFLSYSSPFAFNYP